MSTGFKLRNGTILLSTEAPGGIYNAAQLKKIASLCEGEVAIVKATEDQRLALCVKPEQAATIANELKSIGLGIRHYQDGLHHPTSCIGELCPDHEQDALGSALDISQQLDAIKLSSPLKIGINGCARCCVPCHTLDISVVGDAAGYRLHLGGKNSQLPEMASFMAEGIPPSELPGLILKVIALYQQHAEPAESLQEVIERVGSNAFISVLAPYSQDAAGDADPFATTPTTQEPEQQLADEPFGTTEEPLNLSSDDDLEVSEDLSMPAEDTFMEDTISSDSLPDLDLSPEEMAGDGTETELATDDLTTSALEVAAVEPDDELSLIENEDLSMDAMAEVDLSAISNEDSFGGDINPNSGAMADLAGEVEISSHGDAAHDISLADDFGEDDLLVSTAPQESAISQTLQIDFDALPEAELIDSELTEASIDVSDVMKASAVHTTTTETIDDMGDVDDLNLDEINLAGPIEPTPVQAVTEAEAITSEEVPVDEDAYEQQLTASIAAQEQLVDQTHSDEERESALEFLNDTDTSLEESSFEEESELEDEQLATSSIKGISEALISTTDEIDEFDELESTDPHDHLPLSEVVGSSPLKSKAPTLLRGENSFEASAPTKNPTSTWSFSGFDIDASANPVISFANGVQITLTEDAIANGSINIGGHQILLASINGGIEIKMDGMKMFLPKAA